MWERTKNFCSKYKKVILLFIAVKIVIFVLVFVSDGILPPVKNYYNTTFQYSTREGHVIENGLSSYDSQIYLAIADKGYLNSRGNRFFAFYPLYPMLVRGFSYFLGNDLFLSGIFISLICSFIGVIYLYELFRMDADKKASSIGLFYFLFFPTAIFFSAIYTESLFLMLSVMTFYYARKEKWWITGFLGLLTTFTRPQGILLFLPICIEYYFYLKRNNLLSLTNLLQKTRFNFLSLLLIPVGLLSFFFYAYLSTGNFFLSLDVQRYWSRKPTNVINVFTLLGNKLIHFWNLPWHGIMSSKTDISFVFFFIFLLAFMIRRIRKSYLVYAFLLIFVPLSTGSSMSMTRFLSLSFPHFLYLGILGSKNKIFNILVSTFFIILMVAMAIRFVNRYWVG